MQSLPDGVTALKFPTHRNINCASVRTLVGSAPGIKAAELKIIADCGHLMPIDQPVQLADAIRAFVAKAR